MEIKVYTIEEVARILKVHRTYVATLIREDKLAALKIGRFYRIKGTNLQKLIKGEITRLYTIEEASKILHLNRSNISKLIRNTLLSAVRIGKFYRVREDGLEKLIGGKITDLYTLELAAEILKVHRTYIANLIQNKRLAAIKIGRFYRIRKDQIEKLTGGKLDGAILTIEDIAEILKVHRSSINKQVRDKKIKAVQIGKFYRVREKDFEDFLRKSEV